MPEGSLVGLRFQFTCPSRSTTCKFTVHIRIMQFQFTCPSRSTTSGILNGARLLKFQFTCPSRSTTHALKKTCKAYDVSIHVPLAEHDERLCLL